MTTKASKPKTTSAKKTTPAVRKTTPTSVKPKVAAKSPTLGVVPSDPSKDEPQELRKSELLEMVVTRSQVKKKDAKPVVEAMMVALGEALAEGRTINLQPMGKIMTQRSKDTGTARISTVRIRQSKRASEKQKNKVISTKEPVAKPVK